MAKNAVTDWDATAANNTDIGGISLAEGVMLPSSVNNAIREMMAQIKAAGFSSSAYVPGGTDVAVADGGTGLGSYTAGDLIYATGTTTLAKLAKGTTLQYLRMNSGATAQEWASTATAAEIWAGTATKPITVDQMQAALVEQTLTDGATVTVDFAAGINFKLDTIGGNRALAASNLTNVIGRTGVIRVKQDGTGSRTLDTSGSTWVNVNGQDIVLSTTAAAEDEIYYRVKSATKVLLSLGRAIA